jgi:hypothetical protein
MKKVPREPDRVTLRTGDRVRVDVTADREGYVTVFNVGPTGNLNLLYPDDPQVKRTRPDIIPGRPLHVLDIELVPPIGRERVFAVWSREPLANLTTRIVSLIQSANQSRPYNSTRDLKRIREAAEQVGLQDCHVVVLEHAVSA